METQGEEIELDRTIVEELADPLMHMVRNAIDHGIETPDERQAAGKPGRARRAADGVITRRARWSSKSPTTAAGWTRQDPGQGRAKGA